MKREAKITIFLPFHRNREMDGAEGEEGRGGRREVGWLPFK